jgi:hypothetical protein
MDAIGEWTVKWHSGWPFYPMLTSFCPPISFGAGGSFGRREAVKALGDREY